MYKLCKHPYRRVLNRYAKKLRYLRRAKKKRTPPEYASWKDFIAHMPEDDSRGTRFTPHWWKHVKPDDELEKFRERGKKLEELAKKDMRYWQDLMDEEKELEE